MHSSTLSAAVAASLAMSATALAQVPSTGLVVGVDDTTVPVFIDDNPGSGSYDALFTGADIWGLTWDGSVLHAAEGTAYATYALDGTRTAIGAFSADQGVTTQIFAGLAFDPVAGVLYGSDTSGTTTSASPEGIYSIDPATGLSKIVVDLSDPGNLYDFGVLAFNPVDGLLYGTSDSVAGSVGQGLYSIDPDTGVVTGIASYPAGETDIDGLAYGDGSLWLVTDQGGNFYEYDLTGGTYTAFPSAFTTNEIFSGAAFIPIPEPTSAAVLALTSVAALRRRR